MIGSRFVTIFFLLFWFVGTNHCAFDRFIPEPFYAASSESFPIDHSHNDSNSEPHLCGSPCNVKAKLNSSDSELNEHIEILQNTLFDTSFFLFLHSLILKVYSVTEKAPVSSFIIPLSSASTYSLISSPNAPPSLVRL